MSIDIYQNCPCHSARKIKFCCGKDIVNDLKQIVQLSQGRQLHAALDQANRSIEKTGDRDCLLALKTHFLIKLGEWDEALRVNDRFLANNPGLTIGHQHAAVLHARLGNLDQAVDALQEALDRLPGPEVPISLSNGFKLVGIGLIQTGEILAARAHLEYALHLRPAEDREDLAAILNESYRMDFGVPLLKEKPRIKEPPQDAEWKADFEKAVALRHQGQWRMALDWLDQLPPGAQDEICVISARVAMLSFLGKRQLLVEALRKFSRHEKLDFADAVEAEALAQYFDPNPSTDTLKIRHLVFEVDDPRALEAEWIGHPRLIEGNTPQAMPNGVTPLSAFVLLDRDKLTPEMLESPESIDVSQVPTVMENVFLFGKQTDQPARAEIYLVEDENFESHVERIQNLLGDHLKQEISREPVGDVLLADYRLNRDWYLPTSIPAELRRRLVEQQMYQLAREHWSAIPFRVLDGNSAKQVAGQEEYKIPMAALLFRVEAMLETLPESEQVVNQIRTQLQLPLETRIDPQLIDPDTISSIRYRYLDAGKLTDDQLLLLFSRCMVTSNNPGLRNLIPEMISRESLENEFNDSYALVILARITADSEKAFEYLKQARQKAVNRGEPIGRFLVLELGIRLERGITDKCSSLMREIQGRHMDEPEVEMMLYQTLARFGLVDADGRVRETGEPAEPAETAEPGGGIWTPESESSSTEESKLWLPGSD